ncbi:hypothetical protein ACFC1R_25875 [Kitasatospora sp. NPDC056138]|uniref:hypothetical protein n=1 Tax=Kitasatospora sp. NPDC056138 TaxID=3345724 RepID=UPI0035DFBC2F
MSSRVHRPAAARRLRREFGAHGPRCRRAARATTDGPAADAVNLATNPGFEIPTLPLADRESVPGWNCGIGTVLTATADFSRGRSNIYHSGTLQPGDVILLHFTDTLASDLQRALTAAEAAGLTPAGLIGYLP